MDGTSELVSVEEVLQRVKNKKEAMILCELNLKLELLGVLTDNFERQHRVLRSLFQVDDNWKSTLPMQDTSAAAVLPLLHQVDGDQKESLDTLRSKADRLADAIRELCFSLTTYADINSQIAKELSRIEGCCGVSSDKATIAELETKVVAYARALCQRAVERFSKVEAKTVPTGAACKITPAPPSSDEFRHISVRDQQCSRSLLSAPAPPKEYRNDGQCRTMALCENNGLGNVADLGQQRDVQQLGQGAAVAPTTIAGAAAVVTMCAPNTNCSASLNLTEKHVESSVPAVSATTGYIASRPQTSGTVLADPAAGITASQAVNRVSLPETLQAVTQNNSNTAVNSSTPNLARTSSGTTLYPPSFPVSVPTVASSFPVSVAAVPRTWPYSAASPVTSVTIPKSVAVTTPNVALTSARPPMVVSAPGSAPSNLASQPAAAGVAAGANVMYHPSVTVPSVPQLVHAKLPNHFSQPLGHTSVSLMNPVSIQTTTGSRHLQYPPVPSVAYTTASSILPNRQYVLQNASQGLRAAADAAVLAATTPTAFPNLGVNMFSDSFNRPTGIQGMVASSGFTQVSAMHTPHLTSLPKPTTQFTSCVQVLPLALQHTATGSLRMPTNNLHVLPSLATRPGYFQTSTATQPLHCFNIGNAGNLTGLPGQTLLVQNTQPRNNSAFGGDAYGAGVVGFGHLSPGASLSLGRQATPQPIPMSSVLRGDAAPSTSTDRSSEATLPHTTAVVAQQSPTVPAQGVHMGAASHSQVAVTGSPKPQQTSFAFQPLQQVCKDPSIAATPMLRASQRQPQDHNSDVPAVTAPLLLDSQRDSTSPNKVATRQHDAPGVAMQVGNLDYGSGCKPKSANDDKQSSADAPTPTSKRASDVAPDSNQKPTGAQHACPAPQPNSSGDAAGEEAGNVTTTCQPPAAPLSPLLAPPRPTSDVVEPAGPDSAAAAASPQAATSVDMDMVLCTQLPSTQLPAGDGQTGGSAGAVVEVKVEAGCTVGMKRPREDDDADVGHKDCRRAVAMKPALDGIAGLGAALKLQHEALQAEGGSYGGRTCGGDFGTQQSLGDNMSPLDLKLLASEEDAMLCTQPEPAVC